MATNKQKAIFEPKGFGIQLSITLLLVGLILSIVDLSFLVDVLKNVLNFSDDNPVPYVLAVGIGLIGFSIMATLGARYGHNHRVKVSDRVMHYVLWLMLGIAISFMRLISAQVTGLSEIDDGVVRVFGVLVQQIDFVLAPLMFFMYIAAGLLALEGTKNLVGSSEFSQFWKDMKVKRRRKQLAKYVAMSTMAVVRAQNEISRIPEEPDPRVELFVKEAHELLKDAVEAEKETEKHAEIDLVREPEDKIKSTVDKARTSANKTVQKANLVKAKVDAVLRPIGKMPVAHTVLAYQNAKIAFGDQVNVYKNAHDEVAHTITQIEKIDQEIRTLEGSAQNMLENIKTAALTSKNDITMQVRHKANGGRSHGKQ